MPAQNAPFGGSKRKKRLVFLAFLTIMVALANFAGIISGHITILSHLFYFPVILGAYWYPRRCYPYLIAMGALYCAIVVVFYSPLDLSIITATAIRASTFTITGFVVSFLSYRLKDSEQQLFDTIEFLPDAAFATDDKGTVVVWNKAMEDLTGVGRNDIIGKDDFEYALPFYGERRPILIDMAMNEEYRPEDWYEIFSRDGDILEAEIKIEGLKGGKWAYLQFKASPLKDHKGKVTGGVESIRDITDSVITKSALSNTTKKLNRMTGIILTDLSDRLSVLYGNLKYGAMKFDGPDVISYIEELTDTARGIGTLITRTREYRDIGARPPSWRKVIRDCQAAAAMHEMDGIYFASWTERLEIFADSNLRSVFYYLFDNSLGRCVKITLS